MPNHECMLKCVYKGGSLYIRLVSFMNGLWICSHMILHQLQVAVLRRLENVVFAYDAGSSRNLQNNSETEQQGEEWTQRAQCDNSARGDTCLSGGSSSSLQDRGNVALSVSNGELKGSEAVAATKRVSCRTRQSCTGNTAAPALRCQVCVGRDEELAHVHVTFIRRPMQWGISTKKKTGIKTLKTNTKYRTRVQMRV